MLVAPLAVARRRAGTLQSVPPAPLKSAARSAQRIHRERGLTRPSDTPLETRAMITEYVLFALPPGISRAEVVAGMHAVAPRWRAEPELVRKTFVYDAAANTSGAFYLWKSRAAAEAAHDEAWRNRIRSTYGSEPVIQYFDTPLVVDNALGAVIEG